VNLYCAYQNTDKNFWAPIKQIPQNTWLSPYPYSFRTSCIL